MAKFCISCAALLDPGVRFCGACGTVVEAAAATPDRRAAPSNVMLVRRGRYSALRIISGVLKVFVILIAIGGLITAFSIVGASSAAGQLGVGPGSFGGAAALAGGGFALVFVLGSLSYALFLWGAAEMITVVIDIEENTRNASRGVTTTTERL